MTLNSIKWQVLFVLFIVYVYKDASLLGMSRATKRYAQSSMNGPGDFVLQVSRQK